MNVHDGEIVQLGVVAFTPSGGSEIDFTKYVQDADLTMTRKELDATRMGHTAMARKKGLRDWSVKGNLLQDYDSSSDGLNIDATFFDELDSDGAAGTIRVRVFDAARGPGNPEYTGPVTLFTHTPLKGKVGDLLVTAFDFRSAGNLTRHDTSSSSS
jgi:hypothetical protein